MSNSFFIPPQGLFFRLVGYQSNHVLFSRTHRQPEVFHHPVNEVEPDQFFELIHGTGARAGLFAIRGRVTGRVLFSRMSPNPRVGHIDGNGRHDDNWFRLERGTGRFAAHFRLVVPSTSTAIVSRTNVAPFVINHPSNEIHADQYFAFLFEDMVIDRVVYHVDRGRILASTPLVIAAQTLHNETSTSQEMEFTVEESVAETSTFEYALGFSIAVSTSFRTGIPFIAEGNISVEVTNSHDMTWGTSNTTTRLFRARLPVTAGPHSVVNATSTVTRSTLDVPFTIYNRSVSSGLVVTTEGRYYGVTTWDLRHTVTQVSRALEE